jgi:hypothetical protein
MSRMPERDRVTDTGNGPCHGFRGSREGKGCRDSGLRGLVSGRAECAGRARRAGERLGVCFFVDIEVAAEGGGFGFYVVIGCLQGSNLRFLFVKSLKDTCAALSLDYE